MTSKIVKQPHFKAQWARWRLDDHKAWAELVHQGENTTVSRAPVQILRPLEQPHAERGFIL